MRFHHATLLLFCSLLATLLIGCSYQSTPHQDEWKNLLEDGLTNWTVKINHHEVGNNYANTFRLKDDLLLVRYEGYEDFNEQFGHIFYNQPLRNFVLKFDYRFTGDFLSSAPSYANRNSGVMFHSQSPETMLKDQNWPVSVEMQLLSQREKNTPRPTGNMCSPGTDITYAGQLYPEHCLNSTSPTFQMNEWVHGELSVHNGHVIQKINGTAVLEYDLAGAKKDDLVTGESADIWDKLAPLDGGYIAFQSEGQPIDFKNIYLKVLK